jgi:hypothetical protein
LAIVTARANYEIATINRDVVPRAEKLAIHSPSKLACFDRLCDMREELLAIERSLERVQAAKLEQGKEGSGKDSRVVSELSIPKPKT